MPHHGSGPAEVQPAVRALPEPGADQHARYRHRRLGQGAGRAAEVHRGALRQRPGLLNLLGGMDKVTSGTIKIGEDNIAKYSDSELTRYRANDVGFIFQFYNIMPTLTVDENVNLIKDVTNTSKISKEVLKSVGLAKHANKFPSELSGGEQQRVSIARAIMNSLVYFFSAFAPPTLASVKGDLITLNPSASSKTFLSSYSRSFCCEVRSP